MSGDGFFQLLNLLYIMHFLLYMTITVSGWTVTNGRGILDSPFLDKDVLNRLTQNILDAIDLLESKHRPKRSEMQVFNPALSSIKHLISVF